MSKFGKTWWEQQHIKRREKWLTGCTMGKYEGFFGVEFAGKRVLEIGCGMMVATRQILEVAADLWVVDVSSVAVAKAGRLIGSKAVLLSNVEDMLPMDYFDVVISHLVVQHIYEKEVLHQMDYAITALNENGVFAVHYMSTVNGNDGEEQRRQVFHNGGSISRSTSYFKEMLEGRGKVLRQVEPCVFKDTPAGSGRTVLWNGMLVGKP